MKKRKFIILLVDIIFIIVSFLLMIYFKPASKRFYLIAYYKPFLGFSFLWVIVSIVGGKYNLFQRRKLSNIISHIITNDFVVLAIISIIIYSFTIPTYSRMIVFGTILITFILEIFFSLLLYLYKKRVIENDVYFSIKNSILKIRPYYYYLLFDVIIIFVAFIFSAWLKPGTKTHYIPNYTIPILILGLIWILISLLGDKYNLKNKKMNQLISSLLRIDFTLLAVFSILIYALNFFEFSRLIILGTIIISFLLELFFITIYNFHKRLRRNTDFSESIISSVKLVEPMYSKVEIGKLELDNYKLEEGEESIKKNLRDRYLEKNSDLFDFIDQSTSLENIPKFKSSVVDTHTLFNIEKYDLGSLHLFINFHLTNNIRRINIYFIDVNNSLKSGGHFVGCCETIQERSIRFFKNYPKFLAFPFYIVDFIFIRVFPKIPLLKEVYFAITKGENRAISKAEILGRLSFCGFKIIKIKDIDNRLYFVVKKVQKPRDDTTPSYGPLIKMKRVSIRGSIIYVFKFRTMHPYSEYLQQYIHDNYDLEIGGKFKNDFRITSWGKVFRKLWIDELPQFINLFRGELSIFGVRALSLHYFNLYPDDMKELRTKFKPGLVPPFYVDLPETFDEILDSERKYLLQKERHPFLTDFKYFFFAWYNIIFKHARSN